MVHTTFIPNLGRKICVLTYYDYTSPVTLLCLGCDTYVFSLSLVKVNPSEVFLPQTLDAEPLTHNEISNLSIRKSVDVYETFVGRIPSTFRIYWS